MPTRAVFLVHGVGSQKKGEFLRDILDPLLRFLDGRFQDAQGQSQVQRKVELRPASGPARAEIQFAGERWEVWEVNWADAFYAPNPQEVLLWGWRIGVFNMVNFVVGSLPFLRRSPFSPGRVPLEAPQDRIHYPRGGDQPLLGRLRAGAYDLPVGLSVLVAFLATYFPILLLASVFYLLAFLPSWLLFPIPLRAVVVGLVSYLLEGPGDQYTMMYTRSSMESIKKRLADCMEPYFNANLPPEERLSCDSAAVIAHSGGATLSFAALSDPELWQMWTGADGPPVRIAFFTAGSSLNIASESVPNHPMWDRPLPERVAWIDLWARYDPIPHGPAARWLQERVRGVTPGGAPRGYYRSVRVTNYDSPFADHGGYWENNEEVVSRFLYETTRLDDASQPPAPVEGVVLPAIKRIPDHRRKRGALTLAVLAVVLTTVLVGTSSGWFDALGLRALDVAGRLAESSGPTSLVPDWLAAWGPRIAAFLIGATLVGSAFFIPWQLLLRALGPRAFGRPTLLGIFSLLVLGGAVAAIVLLERGGGGGGVSALGGGAFNLIPTQASPQAYVVGLVLTLLGLYLAWTLFSLWVLSPLLGQDTWGRRRGR